MPIFTYTSHMPVSADELFRWHSHPSAIQKLIPPNGGVEVIKPPDSLEKGSQAILQIHFGPFSLRWVALHTEYQPGYLFVDEQQQGPFRYWKHTHKMEDDPSGGAFLTDEIEWLLPTGYWISLLFRPLVHYQLKKMFRYRHRVTKKELLTG